MRLKEHVWSILNDPEDGRYHWFLWFINTLIITSVAMLTYEVLADPGEQILGVMHTVDAVILTIFSVEYVGRLWTIKGWKPEVMELSTWETVKFYVMSRLKFIFSLWGLIDLMALLPIFPFLRSLRILRLLRLFRSVRVFRYAKPIQTLYNAFKANSLLLGVSISFVIGSITLAAVMLFFAEYGDPNSQIDNFGDTLWWAIVTISTVGFGDITPVTPGGKVIGAALMFAGMFVIALFAGVISSTLVGHLLPLQQEQVRMSQTSDHVVIAGWNDNVPMLIDQMREEFGARMPKTIVMANRTRPSSLDSEHTFVQGDSTKEREYDKVRLKYARTVLAVSDDSPGPTKPQARDASTVLTVFTMRSIEKKFEHERSQKLHICAEILDPENMQHAFVAGADEVVPSSLLGYSVMAHTTSNPGVSSPLSNLVMASGQNLYTSRLPVSLLDGQEMPFSRLQDRLREESGALLLGLVHQDKLKLNPPGDEKVYVNDEIVYLASKSIDL
ncbi:MAG: ion transporter [Myxococcota bacterium]